MGKTGVLVFLRPVGRPAAASRYATSRSGSITDLRLPHLPKSSFPCAFGKPLPRLSEPPEHGKGRGTATSRTLKTCALSHAGQRAVELLEAERRTARMHARLGLVRRHSRDVLLSCAHPPLDQLPHPRLKRHTYGSLFPTSTAVRARASVGRTWPWHSSDTDR